MPELVLEMVRTACRASSLGPLLWALSQGARQELRRLRAVVKT